MVKEEFWTVVKDPFRFLLVQIACTLITGIFLAIWIVAQFIVHGVMTWLQPAGMAQTILWLLQIIFGVITFVPVALFYITDTRIVWLRAKGNDRREG